MMLKMFETTYMYIYYLAIRRQLELDALRL